MIRLNRKLKELDQEGRPIRVALVGAGLMGTGLVSQLTLVNGMKPSLVADRTLSKGVRALEKAGIAREDILVAHKLSSINLGLERGKYVVTDNIDLIYGANVDIVVDATGNPMAGAEIAMKSLDNGKHICLLNVEADMTVGPSLYKKAREKNLVYTGTAGDEPGSCKELLDFAEISGFEVLAMGKGKNNPIDFYMTPDRLEEEAAKSQLKKEMLCGFIDGTNTMIEMTVMANATGFTPDIVGGHGVRGQVDDLPKIFSLKEEGGILSKYKVVDYVHGIAPGVFVIVSSQLDQVHRQMKFLKMGPGPNYILYRPFHLTSLETPISIARAVIDGEATIAPSHGQVCDTVAIAKRDLKKGESLDRIGGFTVYGTIDSHENTREQNLLPIGLINEKTRVKEDIKKGSLILRHQVELDRSSLIYQLREDQDRLDFSL